MVSRLFHSRGRKNHPHRPTHPVEHLPAPRHPVTRLETHPIPIPTKIARTWPLIVDLPSKNGGSFHSLLYVYQRVYEHIKYSINIPWISHQHHVNILENTQQNHGLVGGFNLSEKYEFVNGKDYSIYYGKIIHSCLKPPTSNSLRTGKSPLLIGKSTITNLNRWFTYLIAWWIFPVRKLILVPIESWRIARSKQISH